MTFQFVTDRMDELGMTSYGQLARACGVPTSTITRLLREEPREMPRLATIDALAKGLQVSESEMRLQMGEHLGMGKQPAPTEDEIALVEKLRQLDDLDRVKARRIIEVILSSAEERRAAAG